MRLISNISDKHGLEINKLIKDADEIYIAVAFLKYSGLQSLMPHIKLNSLTINIVVGRHYALTEPKALLELHKLFGKRSNKILRLAKYGGKDQVFHPKLYLFKKGNRGIILSGSANMTKGGMEDNIECSLVYECNTQEQAWKDAYDFYLHLMSDERSEQGNLLSIKQYETFYDEQKKARRNAKSTPSMNGHISFNYSLLQKYYNEYKRDGGKERLRDKESHYNEAREILNLIINDKYLNKESFMPLYDELVGKSGEYGWWYSNGLYRNKTDVYKHYKEFQKLAKLIKDNRNTAQEKLFDNAMAQVDNIPGANVAIVGELMLTYNPMRLANLNSNPVKVLREVGGVKLKKTASAYSGEEYAAYCELIEEIKQKLVMSNMLEVDSFFNYIYQKIK